MKLKTILYLLFVVLVTNGASCVNDGFLVAVDFPIQSTYPINPGPNTSFGGSVTLIVSDKLAATYRENIQNVRYYDIRVSVTGAYAGSVTGSCFVNNFKLLDYSGQWSDFTTPQSLLGSSPHITPQSAGVNELVRILNLLSVNPSATITFSGAGNVSQGPVPAGLAVNITVYAQADTEIQ